MKKRVRAVRKQVLRQEVGLSGPRVRKVGQVLDRFDRPKQKARKQVQKAKQQLKRLFRSKSDDQNAYRVALQHLRAAHKAMQQIREREFGALAQELSPKEQAKLLMSLGKMGHKVRHAQRRRGPKKRGQRAPSAPPAASQGPEYFPYP